MHLTDPKSYLKMVPVKAGVGFLYYVTGPGNLDSICVDKARVAWKGEAVVTPTSFLCNHNLRITPQACRGLLCVFLSGKSYLPGESEMEKKARTMSESLTRSEVRLGVIGYLHLTKCKTIYLYEWIGSCFSSDNEETPSFLYDMLNDGRVKMYFGNHRDHFREVRIDFENMKKSEPVLHFVNLVSTPPSLHKLFKSVPLCTNIVDGCYEMLSSGPDCLFHPESMPKPHQFEGRSLGKALVVDSRWNFTLPKRKRRDQQHHWRNVPEWLRDPVKSIDMLPCKLYAFVNDSSSCVVSSKEFLKAVDRHVAVPYVNKDSHCRDVCEFSYVPAGIWRTMVKLRKASIQDHNDFLDKHNILFKRKVFTVVRLDHHKRGGVKIAVCNKEEYAKASKTLQWSDVAPVPGHDSPQCSKCDFTGGNEDCPGNVVIRIAQQQSVSKRYCVSTMLCFLCL